MPKQKMMITTPLGERVLIRKDNNETVSRGGIYLPTDSQVPNITGRVLEVSAMVKNNSYDFPELQYQKVLFNPRRAIPVSLESDNQLFVVPIDDLVAVFSEGSQEQKHEQLDEKDGDGEGEFAVI